MAPYQTTALEATEYRFTLSGAMLCIDENRCLGFHDYEESHREREKRRAAKAAG
jgi:hypothetical protein